MTTLLSLLPLLIFLGGLFWLSKWFRAKNGVQGPGPEGQTPYGVHGWLAFFIFISYFIAPLISLGQINSSLMNAETQNPQILDVPGYLQYKSATFILWGLMVIWQIWVAHRLRWTHTPNSLMHARILSFAGPWIGLVVDHSLVYLLFDTFEIGAESIKAIAQALMVSLVWGLYFMVSKRCKNTYLRTSVAATNSAN